MKNKFVKLILAMLPLLFVMAISSTATAQCNYVTVDGGNTTRLVTACDFPLYTDSGNPQADETDYRAAIAQWNPTHAEYSSITLPSGFLQNSYFEISVAQFNSFSATRQAGIQLLPSFYHIIQ